MAATGDRRRAGAAGQSEVRVLLTGVPLVHGAERVLELIEDAGAVVVAMENCTGLKPILDDVDLDEPDPIRAIAKKYYHLPCSVMTPNTRRFETLRSLAAKFRPHCVIELVWQACLTYDIESFHVRKLAEEELRLPYLKITTDYSPSDSARISARVEALFETIRARLKIYYENAPQIHLVQRPSRLFRARRPPLGTAHGRANPHRRPSIFHGPRAARRHRRRFARRGPLLLHRRGHEISGALPERRAHDRRGRHAPRCCDLAAAAPPTEGLAEKIAFVENNACATGLPSGQFDFVWGEDAWCYVEDKSKLIAEAARLIKPGGKIAFTDWLEGPAGLTDAEAARYLAFMKFPNILTLGEYQSLLEKNGCAVKRRARHRTLRRRHAALP